jgi:hypothetical protein
MSLKQAQQNADQAWAAWNASPSPANKAAAWAAYDALIKAQNQTWNGTDWMFSPDTQPK